MNTFNVWTDKERLSGLPCVRGHRFSIAQLLAELAEGDESAKAIAADFDINWSEIQGALEDVSMMFNVPWIDGPPKDAREAEINKYRLYEKYGKPQSDEETAELVRVLTEPKEVGIIRVDEDGTIIGGHSERE